MSFGNIVLLYFYISLLLPCATHYCSTSFTIMNPFPHPNNLDDGCANVCLCVRAVEVSYADRVKNRQPNEMTGNKIVFTYLKKCLMGSRVYHIHYALFS